MAHEKSPDKNGYEGTLKSMLLVVPQKRHERMKRESVNQKISRLERGGTTWTQ
jgi:hypothetical protein